MFQQEKEYLEDAYSYYQKTGERSMQYEFSKDNREKQLTIRCLDALCDDGYIQYEYRATGFCGIKLTPKGIHFVENGFQDDTVPSISGNNNIFVTGSGNTISNNNNQLIADVQNSELDPEIKEVLETLLYELKNPALSEKKKESKIKDFLSEISSDALSDTASSTLSTLLMFLFKKIIF